MPAFIFISGYFSKRELPLSVSIRKLAVPYLVYEVIYLHTSVIDAIKKIMTRSLKDED